MININKCNLCLISLPTTDAIFCQACVETLPFIQNHCSSCASPTNIPLSHCGHCLKHPNTFDSAHAILEYQPPISQILLKFKANQLNNPEALFLWLYSAFYHHYQTRQIDALIAIPSSRWKTFLRGHVPAYTLAHQLGQRTDLPFYSELLNKRAWQSPQKGRSKKARRQATPFTLNHMQYKKLPTKANVLIIDDIMTTGASLNHAAKLLKAAGCKEVHCLTLARTPLL